jgi:hypothetical protein
MNTNNVNNTLILMVGLPFASKTTKALSLGHPVINPDAVRMALHGKHYAPEGEGMTWTVCRYMTHALFNAGHHTVVLDGTNTKRRRRDQWISPKWERKFLVSPMDAYDCQQKVDEIEDEVLREQIKESISRMAVDFEEVEPEEGTLLDWDMPTCANN